MLKPVSSLKSSRVPATLISLLLAGSTLPAVPVAAAKIPPVPTYAELPLPDNQPVTVLPTGELSWLGQRPIEPAPSGLPKGCWAWELLRARWDPASGRTAQQALSPRLGGFVYSQLALSAGVLAVTTTGCQTGPERWRFVFVPADGSPVLALETPEAIDPASIHLLPLGDAAAALVTREKDTRHIKVFTVRRVQGGLALAVMPTLPVAYRSDFAAAVAGRDQVMILGGSDGNYRGCMGCRAETHVLDLKAGTWRDGPPMREARSELAASSLPDGSVLVTGGWTKAAEWGSGASRSAERWNPATNRFEALPPMPNGTARHRHLWWDAPWGRTLLVVQGIVGSAQALDTRNWTWRTVGEWASGSEEGGCGFYPFVVGGNAYAWLVNRTEGHYSTKSCAEQKYASLSLLKPPAGAAPPAEPPPEDTLVSYRHGAAFLPAEGESPALAIGGSRHAGMNMFVISSAVDAIGRDGRIATLPSLLTARQNARAFRVAGGVLVVGGTGPDSPYGGEPNPRPLNAEWLPPDADSWRAVSGAAPSPAAAMTQLRDGSLLVLEPGGELRQLRLALRDGKPVFDSAPWPSLNHERRQGDADGETLQIRALDDGRIVVAGGVVRHERIALYSAQALKPGAPDTYVGIGDFLPWRHYEIFEPARRRWVDSAPSATDGGRAIVMADGRVIRLAALPRAEGDTGPTRFALEASSPGGDAWAPLASAGSRLKLNETYRLFAIDDQLFASGELDDVNTGGGPSGVEWLDPASGRWSLLWQARQGDNWRAHQGRILRRSVVGADGQPRTLLIPTGGL